MTTIALTVARMHAVLVTRPGSPVFHVYSGPLTPSGRWVPRASRTACNAHTRRLSVMPRTGVTVELGGRRMCARCSARLSAFARRAEQPPVRLDDRAAFWEATGITSVDLVHALAVASSVDETYAIGGVANLLKGRVNTTLTRRPAEPGAAQGRWDFEDQLLKTRRRLELAELDPEVREAQVRAREDEQLRNEQILATRRRNDAITRAVDRRNRGGYLTPYERQLADSA